MEESAINEAFFQNNARNGPNIASNGMKFVILYHKYTGIENISSLSGDILGLVVKSGS